ncbi:hypothetical protein C1646_668945 [Rhizophagus diaphanus]|nr:hypothetical protein C1646_668945 [Rhizophagus diaphanus] [Rhizophagus sp. MUCL 43196]
MVRMYFFNGFLIFLSARLKKIGSGMDTDITEIGSGMDTISQGISSSVDTESQNKEFGSGVDTDIPGFGFQFLGFGYTGFGFWLWALDIWFNKTNHFFPFFVSFHFEFYWMNFSLRFYQIELLTVSSFFVDFQIFIRLGEDDGVMMDGKQ